ncbi:unnamed protein product [Dovyalis caffra]|uniref:Uncharacterized protein n=1 Tax=Dovyalis caffra TaxID=77055 RepID=A0AAV1RTL4_9ROSI|nr:unnamed protein product [Dovyalis caffra]
MADSSQPLLSPREDQNQNDEQLQLLTRSITNNSFASSFVADADDIPPINGVRDFFTEFGKESIKLWYLAGPAIFTTICQYSLGAITQVFSGHVGTLELAAVSVENSVIAGFSFGLMVAGSLEIWYFMALILFAGYLKNAEIAVDSLSICMNILGWTVMVALGMNAAISVRVSNELGAAHPRTAKFSLVVAIISSFIIGLILAAILLIFRDTYPSLFSNSSQVQELVKELTPLLAFCIVIDNVQPVLSGDLVWNDIRDYPADFDPLLDSL